MHSPRIELGLLAPQASVLPLYYECRKSVMTTGYTNVNEWAGYGGGEAEDTFAAVSFFGGDCGVQGLSAKGLL